MEVTLAVVWKATFKREISVQVHSVHAALPVYYDNNSFALPPVKTSMSVRMTLTVVVRMQSVLTLMAATLAPVLLGILEMDRVAGV